MEAKVPRPRGRPRKRPKPEGDTGLPSAKLDKRSKRRVLEIRPAAPISLLGRYVLKDFEDIGVFLGKVVSYDTGLYRAEYEDGDCEDLESGELRGLLLGGNDFDEELVARKKKLDELIQKKGKKKKKDDMEKEAERKNKGSEAGNSSGITAGLALDDIDDNVEGDEGSSSYLSESGDDKPSDVEQVALAPPLQLPPCSGTIGVPDESVSHLFSVYGTLRSFSVQLYLYPFGLDDFVGALRCPVSNSLLDSIHVVLMQALKRHFERLSTEGYELALKCLRCIDWSLLDALTWPVYMVQYFAAKGHSAGPDWKGFYELNVEKEYYSLPIGLKLKILQILCDDVLDMEELRTEIDIREEQEVGIDPDAVATDIHGTGPRRIHPKYAKTSTCKEREVTDSVAVNSGMNVHFTSKSLGSRVSEANSHGGNADIDANSDECRLCGMDGILLCCDGCPLAYHSRCIGVVKMYIPDGPWYCPECTAKKTGPTIAMGTSLRGGVLFGMDLHGQIYLGTCNHLLVLRTIINAEADARYYNVNDIPKVVQVLSSSTPNEQAYMEICKSILDYWNLPSALFPDGAAETTTDAVKVNKDEHSKTADAIEPLLSRTSTFTIDPQRDLSYVRGQSLNEKSNRMCPARTLGDRTPPAIYIGSCFKPQLYINHYLNGEFAAKAAASLAILSSEESHEVAPHKFDSARKAAACNISLQVKAFSSAAPRFFWPNFEKKDIILRERCGWCHFCKLSSSSKRGCMLNAAVTSATKNAAKIFSGFLSLRNGEASLYSIAGYTLYLEESLRGLISGLFRSDVHRRQWRKQVEETLTWKSIKSLLIELEENICGIALSGDWVKLTDDWYAERSLFVSASFAVETAQKRGPGRRRQRNQSESTGEACDDDGFTWWRGGKLSKFILQKAVLPNSMIKKAACRGGVVKISGLSYADGIGIPRRSRRSIWKAAVESSKNISQLALQVRYLDMNVKWNELVRPEQNLQDTKGPETDAFIFRNASICDKKIVDNKVRYGIVFSIQKHLPTRVMKTVADVEKMQDGNEKYWFPETRVPLYLIKEYEDSLQKIPLPSHMKPSSGLSKLQRKQLKASRRDLFSYLACKRDNLEKCLCASCPLDVLLRSAVTCSVCQGFCHKECALSSECSNGKVAVLFSCKRCLSAKANSQNKIINKHPTTLLHISDQQRGNVTTPVPKMQSKAPNLQLASVKSSEKGLGVVKQAASQSNSAIKSQKRFLSWGVVWKKKNAADTGVPFRQENILLSRSLDKPDLKPICDLCQQPYNLGLTYIHCENCNKWYHTEAIQLDDSRIPEVMGFKCCKCRRIRSPECPYMDPKLREQKLRKKSMKPHKQGHGIEALDSDGGTVSEPKDSIPSTPLYPMEDASLPENDYLIPVSDVEQITENSLDLEWNNTLSAPGLRKLPVRRQPKREDTVDNLPWNNLSNAELLTNTEEHTLMKSEEHIVVKSEEEEHPFGITGWDTSGNGFEGDLMFNYETSNYEDMEFEPQTYFSLTELLETNDDGETVGFNYEGVSGNMGNQFCLTSDDGIEEQQEAYTYNGQPETAFSAANDIPCQICSRVDPAPDLVCRVCGCLIHSHCSPWEEESSCVEGGWSCGRCREWR